MSNEATRAALEDLIQDLADLAEFNQGLGTAYTFGRLAHKAQSILDGLGQADPRTDEDMRELYGDEPEDPDVVADCSVCGRPIRRIIIGDREELTCGSRHRPVY